MFSETAGYLHVIVRVLVGYSRNFEKLGAQQAQRCLFFLALRVRNNDYTFESQDISDNRKPYSGIAGGPFDDGPAGPQRSRSRASSMMKSAARSLTDWPGFMNSALPRISQPVSAEARFRRMRGVSRSPPERLA